VAYTEGRRHPRGFGLLTTGAVLALLVGGLGPIGSDIAAAASPADATVSTLTATPSSLASAGGQVKLSAQVTGATGCEFSSSPDIAGLPVSVACSTGKVKTTVTVPSNPATVEVKYKFTLTVTAASGPNVTATAKVKESAGGTALGGVVSLASDGDESYCAVLSTGSVECWGRNDYGELGNGTTGGPDADGYSYDTPQTVTGLTDAVSVTYNGFAGYCAILAGGAVDCWGYNANGQLGNGTVNGPVGPGGGDAYDTPQAVTGLTDVVSLNATGASTCALLSSGGVDCWGDNGDGELGNGTTGGPDGDDGYDTPQAVSGIADAVSLGDFCAVLSTGGVDCWGSNIDGTLGNGTIGGPDPGDGYDTPQAVTGITDAVSVAKDDNSTCATLSTGGVECWGPNNYGNLGNGTVGGPDGEKGYDTPQAVTGLTKVVSVTGDEYSYCALRSTGAVDCWGDNSSGQLGNSTINGPIGPAGNMGYDTPQVVTGLTDAASVTSDLDNYCAILSTSAVDCWGINNHGQLGNGTVNGPDGGEAYDTPQTVTGLSGVASLAPDGEGVCALLSAGGVDCWGDNAFGELGTGTVGGPDHSDGYDTPVPVSAA